MFRSDATLVMNIQLALIGIIVVLGLFYLWRAVGRIESKLQVLSSQVCASAAPPVAQHIFPPIEEELITEDEAAEAQAFMDQVFGSRQFRPEMSEPIPAPNNVIVEEEAPTPAVPVPSPEETHSEAESASLSKNRLKKLNADQLRELCVSAGLPTEGTRATLIERLSA
jgi:SAP domain